MRFRSTAAATRGFVGCVGWEDCLFKAEGEAFGLGIDLGIDWGGEGEAAAAARAATEEGRGPAGKLLSIDRGDSKGFMGISSAWPKGFSSPSLGLSDSVEPLFRTERAVGGRSSVSWASSI